MKNKLSNSNCCGKILKSGDIGSFRFGVLWCKECSDKKDTPYMAVYEEGILKEGNHFCGEVIK